jgi:dihydroorotate dehydrogenase electron transfer subunit
LPERVETGVVAAVEQVTPRLWLVHLDLPGIAPQVQPGQFVLIRCSDPDYLTFDPYLPRAYFVFAVDRLAGRLSLLVEARGRGSTWLAHRREGDRLLAHGPIGRPLTPGKLTRHLLLLADGPVAVAGLSLLASESARRGASVTLVENVSGEGGLPPHLLQVEVEYRATTPHAGGLLGVLSSLLSWADEMVIGAPASLLDTLAALRRTRLAPFTLHANLPVQAMLLPDSLAHAPSGGDVLPCGTGVCGACVVSTRDGARLFCRDGPVFPLESLRFTLGKDELNEDQS